MVHFTPVRSRWLCVSVSSIGVSSSDAPLHPVSHALPSRSLGSLRTMTAMLVHKGTFLAVLTACCCIRTVYSIRRCGPDLCRDDQVCCVQGNNSSAVTCCKQYVDKTYYNIAMVTRKLSGVLIMLLLFAVGYFVQRMLCSRSRQLTPTHSGHPTATTSQDPLMESCTPDFHPDRHPAPQLPTYDECKRLPTYEETMRDGGRGLPECSTGPAT